MSKHHNHKHGMYKTKFYDRWTSLRSIGNANKKKYKFIGRRWESFELFMEDMYDSYLEHVKIYRSSMTFLKRINLGRVYSKENCYWTNIRATKSKKPVLQANKRFFISK